MISDTVGFIRKLPRHLLSSFRSTLEEVVESDLILEVVDASDPSAERQQKTVKRVLEQIGVASIPRLKIFNKIDRLNDQQREEWVAIEDTGVFVSAHSGEGVEDLRDLLHQKALREACPVKVEVPVTEGALVADLKKWDHEAAS